jgi:hypothetical protein
MSGKGNGRRGREKSARMRGEVRSSLAFGPFCPQMPDDGVFRSEMKDKANNSKSLDEKSSDGRSADYLYQCATIAAALLLVLSAAIL